MTPELETQALELAILDAITAADAPLDAAVLHLYKNNLVFDPATVVIGDLETASYTGFTTPTLVWDVASVSDDGHAEVMAAQATFRPTSSVATNDIYGYYVVNAGGDLLFGGTFEGGPLPMNGVNDVIKLTVVYRLGSEGYASVVS